MSIMGHATIQGLLRARLVPVVRPVAVVVAAVAAVAGVGLGAALATNAHAESQLYSGSWLVKAFGNERTGGTGESRYYSAFGIPQGIACDPNRPPCDFESTPTDGEGNFYPIGGWACAPWYNFGGLGTTMRPAKGETPTTGGKNKRPIPPLYRNPFFFTPNGKADRMSCTATSVGATPGGKGLVQAGKPLTGMGVAQTTGTGKRGFHLAAAPSTGIVGIRGTRVGEFGGLYPYAYSYTYATLRNDAGFFGAGKGPGSFDIQYMQGANVVASIQVKQGAAKFGGTMRMLGAVTSKVCYFRNGGCSRGYPNWLYDVIGAAAPTVSGVVTQGYQAIGSAVYFNTGIGQFSTVMIEGSRFPWTTGSVTVTAVGRGPHKTVHYGQGYDNRRTTTTSMGSKRATGTIQLVTPVMTRWLLPGASWETGGVGILKLKFVPEPRGWVVLGAGAALLAVGWRMRRHRTLPERREARWIIGVLPIVAAALVAATPADAATQLFSGSWSVKVLGNERTGGTGESEFYSAIGIPGVPCNPYQPRCPYFSTPTDGRGNFHPLGGARGPGSVYCAPWYDFGGMGTAVRPVKGETPTTGGRFMRRIPPLYRRPLFFTPAGAPSHFFCSAASTGPTTRGNAGGKGFAQRGSPAAGRIAVWNTASTTNGGLALGAAGSGGIRANGRAGERPGYLWYGYAYTYATLRNDAGFFAADNGPGSFDIQHKQGQDVVASIKVKQGAAKFGGTMRMLGAITSKVCHYRNGGCSLGTANWLFDAIGADAQTVGGNVTQGFQTVASAQYFHSRLGQLTTVIIEGSRFPWTTGSVTVTAVGRGGHRTVHYARGYDNRGPVRHVYPHDKQSGTLQLVTPVVTRWLRPGESFQTAGIGILRFVPEPRGSLMLAAGVLLLGVGRRMRAR